MTEPAPTTAGVRIGKAGKLFYVDTAGMGVDPGDYVVVQTPRGPKLARVVIGSDQIVVDELGDEDRLPVLRLASSQDVEQALDLEERAKGLLPEARSLAEKAGRRVQIDHAEFTLDGRLLMLSWSSETKTDVRSLGHFLGEQFGVEVEFVQVGPRDRARLAGGYGVCGRELCCSSWLSTFPSISIRMAKNQEKPLNPQKISGLCGRLLCCLSYEDEGYREMRQTLPRVGQRCSTPTGEGKVIGVNVLQRQVTLAVAGQRIHVSDQELGTVVRWDPRARDAEPPPSLAPEPIAEPDTIDERTATRPPREPRQARSPRAPRARGKREEAPPQERPSARRQPRNRPGTSAPQPDAAPRRVRKFERKERPSAAAEPPVPPTAPSPPAKETEPTPPKNQRASRRSRGRRSRGQGKGG